MDESWRRRAYLMGTERENIVMNINLMLSHLTPATADGKACATTSPDTRTSLHQFFVPSQFSVASCWGIESRRSISGLRNMFAFPLWAVRGHSRHSSAVPTRPGGIGNGAAETKKWERYKRNCRTKGKHEYGMEKNPFRTIKCSQLTVLSCSKLILQCK